MKKAEVLLKVKHGMSRLDNIWGMGGARQSVENLREKVKSIYYRNHNCLTFLYYEIAGVAAILIIYFIILQIILLVKEYFSSSDLEEVFFGLNHVYK